MYVCRHVYMCARSLGLTLVTVTQSQSPSASQSAFDLSRSAAAEAAAAAAQRFLLLYSLHLRSISFRFRRLQMLSSLSVSLSRILFAPTNLHQKQFDLYWLSPPPSICPPFACFIRCAHSVQLNLITQVRGCLSLEFICLRILNLRGAYVTQVTLRTYV